jgi:hypothetical protein
MGICPICRQENGEVILDARLQDSLCRHVMTPDVCDECKEKYLSKGVLLLAPESCRAIVLKDEVFERVINIPIPKGKVCFVKEPAMDILISMMPKDDEASSTEDEPCST